MNVIGTIRFEFTGAKATAVLRDDGTWQVSGLEGETLALMQRMLATEYDPRRDYGGPSDGTFGHGTVAKAAAVLGGTYTLEPARGNPERIY